MAERNIGVQSKPKKKSKGKKTSRELLILSDANSVKGKIVLAISEVAKQREYFTNADIFTSLMEMLQIDPNDMKRVKSIYNYIIFITGELEREGYLKGYRVPGSRYVHWKLVKPLPL